MDQADGEWRIAINELVVPGIPPVGIDPYIRSGGSGAGNGDQRGDFLSVARADGGCGIVGGEAVSIRGESMIDGIPIMFRIEFAGDDVDGDIQIVQMIEAANEGGFTGQGIIGGDERVSGQEEKIDLEFVTLSLDEFP